MMNKPILGVGVALLMLALGILKVQHHKPQPTLDKPTPIGVAVPHRLMRQVYAYSVLPGGIDTVEALAERLQWDRELAALYKGFKLERAAVVPSPVERMLYASYRKDGSIWWTHHKLRIPKGELLLSDGAHVARVRCGNVLAERLPAGAAQQAVGPALHAELDLAPTAAQLDTVVYEYPVDLPIGSVAVGGPGVYQYGVWLPPVPIGADVGPVLPLPLVPVPEPNTLLLVATGCGLIAKLLKGAYDKRTDC